MGYFQDYCAKLYGQHNGNLLSLTNESTDRIFYLIKNQNNEIKQSKKIEIGKFYIIRYNYNGNKIWCPIFVIDDRYKPDVQKRIVYAINIDYLPYSYRILFFDILFNSFRDVIDYNKKDSIDIEKSFPINFELIYKLLKNNGDYNYAITAFNYLKIDGVSNNRPQIYSVSTNIAHRFLYINTKKVNLKLMRDLSITMDDYNIKNKLNNLIEMFENIKDDLYINQQKEYYKKLRMLEEKYNLIEDNKI